MDSLTQSSFLPAAALIGMMFVLVVIIVLLSRRRLDAEVRSIVEALEGLRSGAAGDRPDVSATSAMGLVADAVQRLGVELRGRQADAEGDAERWRALTDATRDTAIVTTDTDGDIRSFSSGACRLLGWDVDEVLARPGAMLFEESAYKNLLPKLARRSLRTEGVVTRSTLLGRDGNSFEAEVSVRLLTDGAARPVGFLMVMRDISERIRMENDLRASEQRYRGLVEDLTEGVIIVQAGRIAYVNPAAAELCGAEPDGLVGTPWRDQLATADVLAVEATLAEIEGDSPPERRTLRCSLVGQEGLGRADVRIKAGVVDYAGARAALLLVQDETAERQAVQRLQRNEARLDAVLEAASDGILVLSEDRGAGMVQMTNRAFSELFGIPVEQLLGASEDRLMRLLHERGAGAAAVARRIAAESSAAPRETISLDGDAPKEVQVLVSGLAGRQGQRLGRVVACRDLTEQRRSERELQAQAERLQLSKLELEQSYRKLNEVNSRLEARGEELDGLNRELQRLDEMRSDLLGNVSHELQTPLVSIRGYTEMILKERLGPISDEQRKGLSLSLRNIDRLIGMIDNLLAFSRTDPSLREVKLSCFSLGQLIGEAVDLMREEIAAKQLDVAVELEDEKISIDADRDKILQVLLNLFSNAAKYSHERGRIRIAARARGSGHVEVNVADTGRGIPREDLGRVFERHFRVRRDEDAPGSGLGLAIVRDILRVHGCKIDVESDEGKGATFTFTLPVARERSPIETGPPRSDAQPADLPEPTAPPTEPPPAPDEAGREAPGPSSRTLRPRLRIIRRRGSKS